MLSVQEKQTRNVLELMKKYSMSLDAFKSRREKKRNICIEMKIKNSRYENISMNVSQ
jgi:hypothetical protein